MAALSAIFQLRYTPQCGQCSLCSFVGWPHGRMKMPSPCGRSRLSGRVEVRVEARVQVRVEVRVRLGWSLGWSLGWRFA